MQEDKKLLEELDHNNCRYNNSAAFFNLSNQLGRLYWDLNKYELAVEAYKRTAPQSNTSKYRILHIYEDLLDAMANGYRSDLSVYEIKKDANSILADLKATDPDFSYSDEGKFK